MNPAILDDMSWAMAEVYAAVTDRILINLARYFPYVREGAKLPGSFEYQARMLAQVGQVNRETVAIIMQSLGGADDALRGVLERAIVEGLRSEEPALRRAAERGLLTSGVPELTPGMTQAFRSYYRQSADRLNLVNTVMLESTQAAYTATVADIANRIQATQSMLNVAAGEVVTGVSTFNQAVHNAVNRMVQNGLTGFVDHGGHHWSPEAYVAMDVRTTTANTARQAVFDRNQEYGNDLYLVSSHDGARPLCYPWQGKIISTTGRRGETTDLDGNTYTIHSEDEIESFRYGGGLFGVNCGHYPMVWIPGFSTMKGQPQDEEANAKQYEESQQQRALERRLREEKRDLEVLKAQGAPDEMIKAQRQRVRDASAEIDDFCEQTGRARHRDREGAPVRATWPDPDTYDPATFPTEQRDRILGGMRNGQGNAPDVMPDAPIPPEAAPLTIATATNMEELASAAEQQWGVSISETVKSLDFEMTQQALTGIQRITDDFPEVGQALESITTKTRGVMSCSGGQITFNPAYYMTGGRLPESLARNTASGWWINNASAGSIGTHEAAHAIEWFLDTHNPAYVGRYDQVMAWNKCTEAKAIVSEACKSIKRTEAGKGMKNAEIIATCSRYATDSASEALAESFADFYTNGSEATAFAREVVRLTIERYRLFGGVGGGS